MNPDLTANIRTNIMDFRGFDSSRILKLRGGIPRAIGDFPESLSQAILVGIMLVGRFSVVRDIAARPESVPGAGARKQKQTKTRNKNLVSSKQLKNNIKKRFHPVKRLLAPICHITPSKNRERSQVVVMRVTSTLFHTHHICWGQNHYNVKADYECIPGILAQHNIKDCSMI